MGKVRSRARIVGWLLFGAALSVASLGHAQAPVAPASVAPPPSEAGAAPPLLLGIAIDETGMTQGDLQRSQDLVLALMERLPSGSKVMIGSFSGEKRIVLPPTADRALVATAITGFKAGTSGVALPDGLFDMVEYLGGQDFAGRALLLVSAGRVREGDLQFEDPLNAATARSLPIFALALGQGDGKLLRRIAKITGGEYVRLEVADAAMLAQLIVPRAGPMAGSAVVAARAAASPTPVAVSSPSAGLLGAAAIFFSLGGLLMLGIVVLLIRRMSAPPGKPAAISAQAPPGYAGRATAMPDTALDEDEVALEKTLVVNPNPTLRALSGPGAGKNFPLSATGHTSLGRSRRNDIVVPEDGASAQHCRIDREGDSYVLHDLGSTNGTWVNDARTDRAVLQHGDRVKVGSTVFTVSLFGDRA